MGKDIFLWLEELLLVGINKGAMGVEIFLAEMFVSNCYFFFSRDEGSESRS